MLYLLPRILNLPAEDSGEDHSDVLAEGVVLVVIKIQADLVGDLLSFVNRRIGTDRQ